MSDSKMLFHKRYEWWNSMKTQVVCSLCCIFNQSKNKYFNQTQINHIKIFILILHVILHFLHYFPQATHAYEYNYPKIGNMTFKFWKYINIHMIITKTSIFEVLIIIVWMFICFTLLSKILSSRKEPGSYRILF